MTRAKYVICDKCHKGIEKENCIFVSHHKVIRYYCSSCVNKMIKHKEVVLEWQKQHELNTIH